MRMLDLQLYGTKCDIHIQILIFCTKLKGKEDNKTSKNMTTQAGWITLQIEIQTAKTSTDK